MCSASLVEPDEADLVAAAGAGDPDAWEVLYRRLYPKLHGFLGRRVGADHVEDLVSETMARAVRGVKRYQPGPSGFDAWVFGIGRRVAADHHRKTGRLRRQDTTAAGLIGTARMGTEPAEPVVAAEDRAELRRAFQRLPAKDRELLELRVVGELSVDEVATVLHKGPGAVRTAQSRALNRLRKLMENPQ